MQLYKTDQNNIVIVQWEKSYYYIIRSWYFVPKDDWERAKEMLDPITTNEALESVKDKATKSFVDFINLFESENNKNDYSNKLYIEFEWNKTNQHLTENSKDKIIEFLDKIFSNYNDFRNEYYLLIW